MSYNLVTMHFFNKNYKRFFEIGLINFIVNEFLTNQSLRQIGVILG